MTTTDLRQWIGKLTELADTITPVPVAALSATLDRDDPAPRAGDTLPPLWHWLYFLPIHPHGSLGVDGHPSRGGFLPPVPLPRRMWAGGRLHFHRPLAIGDALTRRSAVTSVTEKSGRSGDLVFVTVRHEYRGATDVRLTEEHDIVYRGHGAPAAAPQAAPADAAWTRRIVPDEVLLFRYSALTFNGHRIHYDQPYAVGVEGYPGLVVHGPLIATLLVDLLRRHLPDATLAAFSFKAVRPTFAPTPFTVCGQPDPDGKHVRLWAQDHDGWVTMTATATLEQDGPAL